MGASGKAPPGLSPSLLLFCARYQPATHPWTQACTSKPQQRALVPLTCHAVLCLGRNRVWPHRTSQFRQKLLAQSRASHFPRHRGLLSPKGWSASVRLGPQAWLPEASAAGQPHTGGSWNSTSQVAPRSNPSYCRRGTADAPPFPTPPSRATPTFLIGLPLTHAAGWAAFHPLENYKLARTWGQA